MSLDIVKRLRLRRAEIEEAIFSHVREAVPDPIGDVDAEYMVGLCAAVAAAVDYGLMGIEREDDWETPVPSAAVLQAARAARSGVSLDTVLLRYIAGYTLLGDYVMEEAERAGGNGTRLRRLRRRQAMLLGRLTAAIVNEHQRELKRLERLPAKHLADRVQRTLIGEPADSAELGYELDAWHLGVIATGRDAEWVVRGLAKELGRQALIVARSEGTVWAWFGDQCKPAIADVVHLLLARSRMNVSLAIGEPARGLRGFRLTHRQAQAALLVALRKPQWLTRYADVALLALALRDEALTRSLVDIYLAPLDGSRKSPPVLRQTLRAYFVAERNASSAAAALGVGRHTIENRLRRVEQRLDRKLSSCLPELEIALSFDDYCAATSADESESVPG